MQYRWILSVGTVVLAASLTGGEVAAQQGPPPVFVAAPLIREITEWDEYFGQLEAAEAVAIRARVSGFLDQVHFRDGEQVETGDLLFTIDPRPFEIAADAARADVSAAKARRDFAVAELNRARPLAERRTISRQALEERQFEARAADAALASAQAALRQAELELEWTAVRSPLNGRVSDKRVDVGNLISGAAEGGTVLTEVVSLSPIYVAFEASEADFLRYSRLNASGDRRGARETTNPVQVKLADEEGWPHRGHMDFLDNVIDPRSGTIRGRATLEGADEVLAPGLFVRLRLFGGRGEAMMIPDAAVLADQARRIVLVVGEDDVVQPRPVELGPIVDGLRVVRAGLSADDQVIVEGLMRARPGAPVTPQPAEITPGGG